MSIAEKLIAVAENIPKVYEAGRNGFGYKKTFTGESLEIEDIVPTRHTVLAKLSSKNLYAQSNQDIKIDPTKTYFLSSDEGTQSRINLQFYDIEGNKITKNVSCYGFYFSSASDRWMSSSNASKLNHSMKFTGADRDKIAYIRFLTEYPNMQLEEGTAASQYAPYISDFSNIKLIVNGSDIYSSDEKGAVEKMTSAPTMKIISNTPGVIISAECFVDAAAYVKKLETAILNLGGKI